MSVEYEWEDETSDYHAGEIATFSRDDFNDRFHYRAGEHVVFGGPTQRGKTTLAKDLVAPIARPDFPAYVAVSKPMDGVSEQFVTQLHFRRVAEWPPGRKIKELKMFDGPPRGYVIWPKFGDINTDVNNCARVTAKLMEDRYAQGTHGHKGILIMDDTMVKAKVMGLDGQMVTILAMAGAMGIGIWVFVQKPTDSGRTTLWAYENATHLFFAKGGDSKMLDRYAEIAGARGPMVKQTIPRLKPYQFLYMHKYEEWVCIVDSK